METVRFLRDIEDETKYAQGLEVAYLDAFNALTDVSNRMIGWVDLYRGVGADEWIEFRVKELRHVLFTMSMVIRDCVDRRKRLANVAAGLPNVVLDEERS